MKVLNVILLTAVLALMASAADLSGTWNGTFKITMPNGQTTNDTVHLVLKQDGARVTGTAGPSADQQRPIARGTIEGARILFELPVPEGIFKFDLSLDGDHLRGDVTRRAGAESIKARMDAMRAK